MSVLARLLLPAFQVLWKKKKAPLRRNFLAGRGDENVGGRRRSSGHRNG